MKTVKKIFVSALCLIGLIGFLCYETYSIVKKEYEKQVEIAQGAHEQINFNLDMIRSFGIKYFDGRIQHSKMTNFKHFDTGSSFLYEIKKAGLPYKDINHKKYIEHFGNASWNKDVEDCVDVFLEKNREYYC